MESNEPNLGDGVIYCNCMDEIKRRINVIRWQVNTVRVTRQESVFATELIFVQFRKILELIAFASLTSNKEKYSKAFDNYHAHWKAKSMLKELTKINPEFYPMPVHHPVAQPDGTKLLNPVVEGFLTQEEFVQLYGVSSEIIHMRNPFSEKDPVTQIGYSVDIWVERIQTLLRFHRMTLVSGDQWVVEIPNDRPAKLWLAVPRS